MDFTIFDFFLKLFLVSVAAIVFRYLIKYLDRLIGVDNFKKTFEGVKHEPVAFSLYLGFRLVAVAILISSII